MTTRIPRAAYWNTIADAWAMDRPHRLWRHFSDELHAGLLAAWLPAGRVNRVLKTDAFDEANGNLARHLSQATTRGTVVTLDLSTSALQVARRRHARLLPLGGDVRAVPIQSESFDVVVSTSTLDHLDRVDEIGQALGELHRVLRPGGRLILTLDNRTNPVVALRSVVPQRWLRAVGLIPYETGANCGARNLVRLATAAGLTPIHVGWLMHCPRVVCVWIAALIGQLGRPSDGAVARGRGLGDRFVRSLLAFEALERWPSRFVTGHFVVLVAERRTKGVPS